MNIGFAGLSHLGIVTSIVSSSKGVNCVAYDQDSGLIASLQNENLPLYEPDLDILLSKHKQAIEFTSEITDLSNCDLIYISQDVPTDTNNKSSLESIENLLNAVVEIASGNCEVVLLCQVPPGFLRKIHANLSKEIDKKNLTLIYQVETLIFGRAVERASSPERFIIGLAKDNDNLPTRLEEYLSLFKCPILTMAYESAELSKIAINLFLMSSLSTTSFLSELCEKIGANWGHIKETLHLDARIGPKAYLLPGLGVAGGNLERDLVTVKSLLKMTGSDHRIVDSWQSNFKRRKNWVLDILFKEGILAMQDVKICILGLAYKQNTKSLKNSAAIELISDIEFAVINAFDPLVKELPGQSGCELFDSPEEACKGCDALVVMTPWEEFKNIDMNSALESMRRPLIIDPYAVFNISNENYKELCYFSLGISPIIGCRNA